MSGGVLGVFPHDPRTQPTTHNSSRDKLWYKIVYFFICSYFLALFREIAILFLKKTKENYTPRQNREVANTALPLQTYVVRSPWPTLFNLLSFDTSTSTLNHLLPKLNCWLTCLPSLYWPPHLPSNPRGDPFESSLHPNSLTVLSSLYYIILPNSSIQTN